MGVSRLQPAGGANDFTLDVGSSGNTTFTLTKEYAPGAYSITSQLADASLDIYLINADGSSAGYTNSKSLTATKGFNKIVVYGASTNDLLIFEYKTTFSPTAGGSTLVPVVPPFVTSVSPSDLPDIDGTTTITGGNFATDVEVTFTGTNAVALDAKSIVRASATSILVTRPDTLIQDHSPYDVTVSNPGATAPTGSNVHKLNDAITAGGDPVWVTSAGALTIAFEGEAYSATVEATDPDGGTITYSLATGSLPTGLSFNGSTGVISGTPSATGAANFTIAATDTGGNITNRSFSIAAIAATGGTVTESGGYRYHTFNSSGTFALSGADLAVEALIVAGGGGGGSRHAGGGGAGGYIASQLTLSPAAISVVIGAGGANAQTTGTQSNGVNSSLGATTAIGGGYGGGTTLALGNEGGSGGGNSSYNNRVGGSGTSGQGNRGSDGSSGTSGEAGYAGGGGGGAGAIGSTANPYGSVSSSSGGAGGAGLQWLNGTFYAGGGGGGVAASGVSAGVGGTGGGGAGSKGTATATNGTANTGGGGGGSGFSGGSNGLSGQGGSGIVIIRYPI